MVARDGVLAKTLIVLRRYLVKLGTGALLRLQGWFESNSLAAQKEVGDGT